MLCLYIYININDIKFNFYSIINRLNYKCCQCLIHDQFLNNIKSKICTLMLLLFCKTVRCQRYKDARFGLRRYNRQHHSTCRQLALSVRKK